jgi:hypothetical protein
MARFGFQNPVGSDPIHERRHPYVVPDEGFGRLKAAGPTPCDIRQLRPHTSNIYTLIARARQQANRPGDRPSSIPAASRSRNQLKPAPAIRTSGTERLVIVNPSHIESVKTLRCPSLRRRHLPDLLARPGPHGLTVGRSGRWQSGPSARAIVSEPDVT